jgi:predicted HTH domain antitoxin
MKSVVIEKFPLFEKYEEKEKFFTVLGLLFTRQITLAKAAELLEMTRGDFSRVLKLMGLEYSYLSEEEIELEKKISEIL